MEFINRKWHQYVLRHTITFHPATPPDDVMLDSKGRPAINVYTQIEFAVPLAHYECACGAMWMR